MIIVASLKTSEIFVASYYETMATEYTFWVLSAIEKHRKIMGVQNFYFLFHIAGRRVQTEVRVTREKQKEKTPRISWIFTDYIY
jgi:hypothetical protein